MTPLRLVSAPWLASGPLPAFGHPPPFRERARATNAAEGGDKLCLWFWFPSPCGEGLEEWAAL